jgi:lipid-A-disaccharide synthase
MLSAGVSSLVNPLEPAPLIYLIAGEPSGDLLGAKLMAALKQKMAGKVRFAGIGGAKMIAEGLESLFPYQDLAIMGFAEVLPKLPTLIGRINQTVKDIITLQPRCIITIDSPGFNFRIARKLRANKYGQHLKIIHYVAPTVWAYKPERAAKMRGLFDYLMTVLPFEPPYFERVGLPCSFVGHPITEGSAQTSGDAERFRKHYDISAEVPILTLLPGSRLSEINRHLPVFTEVVQKLRLSYPHLVTVIVTPPHLLEVMKERLAHSNWPLKIVLLHEESAKQNAFAASTLALCKSGTIALELALARLPMIVTYKTSALTAWLLRRMIRVRYVNLINILLDKPIIPELLQEECAAAPLTQKIEQFLSNSTLRKQQLEAFHTALQLLRGLHPEPPSHQAANIVLEMLKKD